MLKFILECVKCGEECPKEDGRYVVATRSSAYGGSSVRGEIFYTTKYGWNTAVISTEDGEVADDKYKIDFESDPDAYWAKRITTVECEDEVDG